jgi:crotonobetainyl-CoA:carnitine CoA-transferase CaiB-like acyl-CoA transferase
MAERPPIPTEERKPAWRRACLAYRVAPGRRQRPGGTGGRRRSCAYGVASTFLGRCCPVNTLDQVFADPQVEARQMRIAMPHPLAGKGQVDLIATPIKMSNTPPCHRRPPPCLGEHTDEVLEQLFGLGESARQELRRSGVL